VGNVQGSDVDVDLGAAGAATSSCGAKLTAGRIAAGAGGGFGHGTSGGGAWLGRAFLSNPGGPAATTDYPHGVSAAIHDDGGHGLLFDCADSERHRDPTE